MSDPRSSTASVLAVVTTAIERTKSLNGTVSRYKSRDKNLQKLQGELEDLLDILGTLEATSDSENPILSLLKGPLSRCSQLCHDFEISMVEFGGTLKPGFRGWTKMEFMRGDINDFMEVLAGYKATVSVALGTITMHSSRISQQVLEVYSEIVEDPSSSLNVHLQRIDKKLAALAKGSAKSSDLGVLLKYEIETTMRCLEICEDASSYPELTDRNPSPRLLPIPEPNTDTPNQFGARMLTRSSLHHQQNSFAEIITRLRERVDALVLDGSPRSDDESFQLQRDIATSSQSLEESREAATDVSSKDFDQVGEEDILSDSVSEPDTIFSKSYSIRPTESSISDSGLTALDELVELLFNHGSLHSLYGLAIKRVTVDKLQRHLHGFFSDYGNQLQQEARTPAQRVAANFVLQSASRVATKISLSMQDPAELPRDYTSLRDEALRTERLNAFLRRLQFSSGHATQMDESDDESDEKPQNLYEVKSFLTSTQAFKTLCHSMSDWLKPSAKGPADMVDIEPQRSSGPRRKEVNVGRSLPTLVRFLSSICIHLLVYWKAVMVAAASLKTFWEPRVAADQERLRWRCSCGEMLYGDFYKKDPEALSELAKSLQSLGGVNETCHTSHSPYGSAETFCGITTRPTQQSAPADLSTTSLDIASQTTDIMSPTGSPPESIDSPSRDGIIIQGQSTALSIQNHVPRPRKAYFEICVNSGEYAVVLGEADVSSVKSDGELFDKIWSTYDRMRRSWLRKMFVKPRRIHFVYFGVRHRFQAGIYREPMEIPPIAEVNAERYHYHECPLKVLPPIPSNIFLHYLSCARRKSWLSEVPGAHDESYFLERLPKKVHHSIFDELTTRGTSSASNKIAFGWGVHIIEGPNHASLSLALGIGVMLSFVVSLVVLGIAGTQEQGFGIGQYLLAVVACVMGALYFKLQEL